MEAILIGLDLLGFDTKDIKQQWDALVAATGARQTPEYRKACPKQLLELAAVHTFEGTKKIGCRIVNQKTTGTINDLLNNAWTEFSKTPPPTTSGSANSWTGSSNKPSWPGKGPRKQSNGELPTSSIQYSRGLGE
jgi:hypothetical protein